MINTILPLFRQYIISARDFNEIFCLFLKRLKLKTYKNLHILYLVMLIHMWWGKKRAVTHPGNNSRFKSSAVLAGGGGDPFVYVWIMGCALRPHLS